jgi:anti-sigma factor RsiW
MTSGAEQPNVSCQEFVGLVTDYLEGVLAPEVRDRVEQHLALCPYCEEYLDEIRRTAAALGHVPVEALSPSTRDGIVAAFRGFTAGRP